MFNIEDLINNIKTDWKDILLELIQPYKNKINEELTNEYLIHTEYKIYPSKENIFRAFDFFNINYLQVIILGQDPYQTKGYADGLCFSVPNDIKTPRSLKNIFKELELNYNKNRKNNLEDWATQGVLMLNCSLSVIDSKSNSHSKIWKEFTNSILSWIGNNVSNKVCVILWGNYAISYSNLFNNNNFLILTHSHPSPLSRKQFIGNNNFIDCNKYINNEIKWV